MFVRQLAYLRAELETKVNLSVSEGADGEAPEKATRLKRMRDERNDPDYFPDMPPCDTPFIIEWLFDVGPMLQTGMGPIPLTEQELLAWQINRGFELQPWQSKFLRQLSAEYLIQLDKSKKERCPAPWQEELQEEDQVRVARKVKSLWR